MPTGQRDSQRAIEGRERLLDMAEELLDRHGLEGVSARAITQAAGHRNNAAVHYHFGTRAELVEEVLTRRQVPIDEARHHLLDELEAKEDLTLEDLLVALYQPLMPLLERVEGRRYLRLLNQASHHPAFVQRSDLHLASSVERLAVLALPWTPDLDEPRLAQRTATLLAMSLTALAQQAWLRDQEPPPRPVMAGPDLLDELVRTALALARA